MRFTKVSKFIEYANEILRETNKEVKIGNLTYDVVNVLKKVDPIAYRCFILDIADAEGIDLDELEDDEDF